MDGNLVQRIDSAADQWRVCVGACLNIILGTTIYGYSFGLWRSPLQAVYSAGKMPMLFFSVVVVSALINFMLAQLIGARMSFRQVLMAILVGMSVTAVLLGAFSPVILFFVLQVPGPLGLPGAGTIAGQCLMPVYQGLLIAHVVLIAVAGISGNIRIFRILVMITGEKAIAWRILAVWLLITGFAGCELSWLMSPFLARPDLPVPFLNPNAFSCNFFEYLWRAITQLAG